MSIIKDYAEWRAEREELTGQIDPPSRDWHASDDVAFDLLDRAMGMLDLIDQSHLQLVSTVVRLRVSISGLAEDLRGFDIGHETFQGFGCREIEALADVLREGGEFETADQVIAWHALGDDEGDDHWTGDAASSVVDNEEDGT